MKHLFYLKTIFTLIFVGLLYGEGWGQTTISFNGAEDAGTTWTVFSTTFSIASTNTGYPAERIKGGVKSFQKSGTGSLTTNSFSLSGYENCFVEIWTASISTTSGNGADNGDFIKVYLSQTSSFSATPDITIDGTNNLRYGMSGTGNVTTTAGTPVTYDYPAGGAISGASAKSKLVVNIPTDWTTVYLKIESFNNDANEIWCLDDISLKGTLITVSAPTTQATEITFSNVTTSGLTTSWTNGNGSSRAVFVKEGAGSITNPVDGTSYNASADWNTKGTQLGTSGYYCVYNGNSNSVTLTNLLSSTTYWVQVFEYNGSGATSMYLTTTSETNPKSQPTNANTTPTITVETITGFGNQVVNTISAEKSYNVSGSNLTADITVTAPTGFKVTKTSGSGYSSSVSYSQTGGTVSSSPVYVVFEPTLVQAYSGNITHQSTGATTQNVAVSGTGISPANPATFTATAASSTQINLSATANANSNDVVVVYDGDNTFTAPTDGNAAGNVGDAFAGGTIMYKGVAASLGDHTGLSSGQTVYYKAFSVDALHFYSSGSSANATTSKPEPTNHATDFGVVIGPPDPDIIDLGWDDAIDGVLPDAYLLKASTISYAAISSPVDGIPETNSTLVKNVNQGVMDALFTGLDPNTTYYFRIFP